MIEAGVIWLFTERYWELWTLGPVSIEKTRKGGGSILWL